MRPADNPEGLPVVLPVLLDPRDPEHAEVVRLCSDGEGSSPPREVWGGILVLGYRVWREGHRYVGLATAANERMVTERVAAAIKAEGDAKSQAEQEMRWALRLAEEGRDRAIDRYRQLELDIERRVQEAGEDARRLRDRDAEHFKWRLEEECGRLRETCTALRGDQVLRLESELAAKDAEIRTLRGTNACKGAEGEQLVCTVLQRAFPDQEVRDVSGLPHAGDLEIEAPGDGFRLLVECKNKRLVQRADIERFRADMRRACQHVGGMGSPPPPAGSEPTAVGAVGGGVLVSVQTACLPGLGPLHVEMLDTGQCLLFVGFDGPADCSEHLGGVVRVFHSLCRLMRHHMVADDANGAAAAVWRERYMSLITEIQYVHETLHRQRIQLRQFTAAHQEESRRLLGRLQARINAQTEIQADTTGQGGKGAPPTQPSTGNCGNKKRFRQAPPVN